MAYKQTRSILAGTKGHRSALKQNNDAQIEKMMKTKGWNEGKKISDYTPEELARIRDPKYQADLSRKVDAEIAANKKPKKETLNVKPGSKADIKTKAYKKKDVPVKPTDKDMKKYSDLEKHDDDKVDPDAPGTPGTPGYEPPVKRSDLDAKGKKLWDSKRKSPAKQKLNKGGEAQDQDKIFDKKGNHIGTYVNGKKVMKSTTSAHGQLDDAQREFEQDLKDAGKIAKKPSPAKQYKKPTGSRAKVKPEKLRKKPMTNKEMNKDDSIQTRISEGSIETQALRRKENKKQSDRKNSPAKQVDLSKKTGLGPSAAFGGVKNRELVPEKKTKSRKVMKDGPVNKTQAAWLAKNKANFEKMTASEKKNAQDAANAKRKAFEASPEYKARRTAINNKKK